MDRERGRPLGRSIPFARKLEAAVRAQSLAKRLRNRVPVRNTTVLVSVAACLGDFVSKDLVELGVTGSLADFHDPQGQVIGNIGASRSRGTEESVVGGLDEANNCVHVLAFNVANLDREDLALEEVDRGFGRGLNTLEDEKEHEGPTLLDRMEFLVLFHALGPQRFIGVVAKELEGVLHVFLDIGLELAEPSIIPSITGSYFGHVETWIICEEIVNTGATIWVSVHGTRLRDVVSTYNGEHIHDVVVNGMVFKGLELNSKVVTMLQDTVVVLLSGEYGEFVTLGENKSSCSLHEDLSLFRIKISTRELVPKAWCDVGVTISRTGIENHFPTIDDNGSSGGHGHDRCRGLRSNWGSSLRSIAKEILSGLRRERDLVSLLAVDLVSEMDGI